MVIRDNSLDKEIKVNQILNTSRLSLSGKGLLLYLLNQEDDYELSIHDLAIEHCCSQNVIEKAIDDLQRFGYIDYEIIKNDKGIIDGKFIIYDTPHSITMIRYDFKSDLIKNLSKADKKFIKNYLSLNRHKKRDRKISTLLEEMRADAALTNWDNIYSFINEMPYEWFLMTEYWLIISYYLKNQKDFTCEVCGKRFNLVSQLNVHHDSYDNHGKEHLQEVMDNDLRVLCISCHKAFHKIKEDREENQEN